MSTPSELLDPIIMTSLADTAALEDAAANLDAAQAIEDMQRELRHSIALATEIKQENAVLKKQLQDADALANVWKERHAEWKEVWRKERESVLSREKELEKAEAQWKAKLEEQRRELKQIETKRRSLGSSDAACGVHSDLMKELRAEHASKIEGLTQEAKEWREQFYETRKSHEGLESKNLMLQDRLEREKGVTESLQKELASLQESFAEYVEHSKSNASSTSSETAVRDLKTELEEKELLLERLRQEVKGIQKARDEALVSKNELLASHQAEYGKSLHERAKLEANAKTLEGRLQAARKEATEAVSSKAELEEVLQRTSRELNRLRETMAAKEEVFAKDTEQLRLSLVQSESQLKKQLAASKEALVEEQAKTKELEQRCLATHEHAMKQIADLAKDLKRDDSSAKLLDAQDQIIRLENTCANLKSELQRLANDHQAEVMKLKHACESTHKDLNVVLLEKKDTEKKASIERTKAAAYQKELEKAERLLLQQEEKQQALADEKMKLSDRIEVLASENESLASKAKGASEQTKALHDEVEKVSSQLAKEQRRSSAYKQKALEAQKRALKAKEVLNALTGQTKAD